MGGNETKVTHGMMAGSAVTILWWALSNFTAITPTVEVVGASVMLVTALFQYYMPVVKA